jgi:hypothetical protein
MKTLHLTLGLMTFGLTGLVLGCGDTKVVYPSDTKSAPPAATSRMEDAPPKPIPLDQLGK